MKADGCPDTQGLGGYEQNMKRRTDRPLHLTDKFTTAVDYARQVHISHRKGTRIPYMARTCWALLRL
jgi:hypothetical protein